MTTLWWSFFLETNELGWGRFMLFTITLNKNKDFLRLYRNGKAIASKACICYFIKNNCPYNRIGFTTSKKIGNAVCRNRSRRIIKAAYRELEMDFPIGFDIVFVARKETAGLITQDVVGFLKKRVIKEMKKNKKK